MFTIVIYTPNARFRGWKLFISICSMWESNWTNPYLCSVWKRVFGAYCFIPLLFCFLFSFINFGNAASSPSTLVIPNAPALARIPAIQSTSPTPPPKSLLDESFSGPEGRKITTPAPLTPAAFTPEENNIHPRSSTPVDSLPKIRCDPSFTNSRHVFVWFCLHDTTLGL